ncbi:MAG: hypothetical protein IGNPGNKH_00375 [Sodalis sp. Ffu]|nr:MAG: hypothetical protein IGNPGNKH_00375 [Sodalis sp. Ffu]
MLDYLKHSATVILTVPIVMSLIFERHDLLSEYINIISKISYSTQTP